MRAWMAPLLALALAGAAAADEVPATARHGTVVDWVTDPEAAVKQAQAQQKLLLVLWLSGDFPVPDST